MRAWTSGQMARTLSVCALVSGVIGSATGVAQASCCSPEMSECSLDPSTHWEARCRVGEEIVDGDLSDIFECWTSGVIFINPANPFTWAIAWAAGELYCDGHFTENVCQPKNFSSVTELPNGIDDNCDHVGLGDEFCDGIDNDGDGHVDEDRGSCMLRFLAVPLCWQGTDAAFVSAVETQANQFLEAAGLQSCSNSIRFEKVLPSQFNAPCPGGSTDLDSLQNAVVTAALPGIKLDDFDALAGFTDRDLDGTVRGATDTHGRFWAETTTLGTSHTDIVSAHEFGHVLGFDDEYCSSHPTANGSAACNSPTDSINFLGGDLGCDPASSTCCSTAFRNPNAQPTDYPDTATPCSQQYNRCCVGNLSVEDPTATALANDDSGRCVMSSSFEQGPRHYCQRCLNHIRDINLVCGTVHQGSQRILVANGIISPSPVQLSSVSYMDGRGGLQNFSPKTTGDVVVEFRDAASNSLIAARGLLRPTLGDKGEFARVNSFSLRIPLPDGVSNSSPIRTITKTGGVTVGQTTINGSPPKANAGPDQVLECKGRTTAVTVSGAQSSDLDGDTLNYLWRPSSVRSSAMTVDLELGRHEFELVVGDGLYSAADQVAVTIQDTTKPTVQLQPMKTFVGCTDTQLTLAMPATSDLCSDVSLTGAVVESTNPSIRLPVDVSLGRVVLPVGVHKIEWRAADSSGNVTVVRQSIQVASAIHATNSMDIRDYAQLVVADAPSSYASVTALGRVEVGYDADIGNVTTAGNVFLRSLALVHGYALAGGLVDGQPLLRSQVTGALTPYSLVGFPPGFGDLSAITVPTSSVSVQLEPTQTASIVPGNYDTLLVKRDARLNLLGSGVYYVRRLILDDKGNLSLPAGVTIIVKDELLVRGNISSKVAIGFLGTNLAPIDRPFNGTIVAPRASVTLSANYRGWLIGANVLVEPRVVLTCDPASPNPTLLFK